MTIAEIGALLKTQDNRITADPIFMVQERHRVYGMDPGYSDDYQWEEVESGDFVHATPEQAAELDRLLRAYCVDRGRSIDGLRPFQSDMECAMMNLQYIRVKGAAIWHAIEEPLTFGGYRTLCGISLPPRDLTRPTKTEPRHRHEYCDDCWRVEADDNT